MNELIDFIKEHPHCPNFGCTTCGGPLGFRFDLEKWVNGQPIDLANQIRKIKPKELLGIEYWNLYLDEVVRFIPKNKRSDVIYPDWFSNLNEDFQYDFFALRYAPMWFFQEIQNEMWINVIIRTAERKHMDREIHGLINFLGEEMSRFRSLVTYQEHIEWQYERWGREERKKEEKRAEEKSRIQAIVDNLSEMDEITRFYQIIEDQSINLSWLPKEWASVSDDLLEDKDSKELTRIIILLSKKTNKSGKSIWRGLRSHLYRLRQKKYNLEQNHL